MERGRRTTDDGRQSFEIRGPRTTDDGPQTFETRGPRTTEFKVYYFDGNTLLPVFTCILNQ